MEKNKTGQYLKYAVGEIILVVIGILIALSINNWNENRKDSNRLRTAMKSLHTELVSDSTNISAILVNVKKEVAHNRNLLLRAYDESTNLDTLIKIIRDEFSVFWVAHHNYQRSTFDNLKSNGSFEILTDSIKSALSDFYTTQDYWINVIDKSNLQYQNRFDDFTKTYNLTGRYETKNLNTFVYNSTWSNIDSKHFVPRAISMLGAKNVLWKNHKQELESIQLKTRVIIDLIKPYLSD